MVNNSHTQINSPFKTWVISDFSLGQHKNSQTSPIQVDATNKNAVLASFMLDLPMTIENLIPHSNTDSLIHLPIKTFDDFNPEKVALNVEVLNPYYGASQVIKRYLDNVIEEKEAQALLKGYLSVTGLATSIETLFYELENQGSLQSSKPVNEEEESVDRLLGMLDLGEAASVTPATDIKNDNGRIVKYKHALNEIRRPLFLQLNKILHHTQFQSIERSWRGLSFLLQNTPQNVDVHILDCDKQSITTHIYEALNNVDENHTPNLLIFDFALDCTNADLSLLEELILICDTFQIQSTINLSNNFFGVHSAAELNGLTSLAPVFSKTPFVKWNSLRSRDSSRWIGCCFNKILLRHVYNRHNNSLEFVERVEASEDYLFGCGSWLLGRLVSESMSKYNWPTEISPPKSQLVELPQYTADINPNKTSQLCLEAYIDENLAEQLSNSGVIALQCEEGKNTAFIKYSPLLFKPPRYHDELVNLSTAQRNTFAFQLLSSYIADFVLTNKPVFIMAGDINAVKDSLEYLLKNLIENSGEGADITLELEKDASGYGQYLAKINLKMGSDILTGLNVQLQLVV